MVKTYAIVACMLTFTTVVTVLVMISEEAKKWIREHYYIHFAFLVVGIALLCTLMCCMKHARIVPRNYILLALFTICWTGMVAGFTQWYEPEDVVVAASLTAAMTIGLTLFACCTKMKLTWLWSIGACLSIAFWPLILFFIIFPTKLLYVAICGLVVVLTSIYIVWDTKLIMKKLELDEYIIGALLLYVDIVQLFMCLL